MDPPPTDVHAPRDFLEAADVAVVGRDEEGRLRRPLVLIIGVEEDPEGGRQRQVQRVHGPAAAAAPEGTGARV